MSPAFVHMASSLRRTLVRFVINLTVGFNSHCILFNKKATIKMVAFFANTVHYCSTSQIHLKPTLLAGA